MKKFKVTSYDFQPNGNVPAIDVVVEATSIILEDGLIVFKNESLDAPVAIFSDCTVWVRELEDTDNKEPDRNE